MIRFYYHPTPNPAKVALFLEETGLPYEVVPVDTSKGQQHALEFGKINPNGKVPAIVDTDGPGGAEVRVFDSTAILLYLAEKTGKLLGQAGDRGELLSWLSFIATGLGPFSGQAVHFQRAAPEKLSYAINRYRREAERHYAVLDSHLDWVLAVRQLLLKAGLDGADLAGSSVGGSFLAEVAAIWPAAVRRLALIAPWGLFDEKDPMTDPWAQRAPDVPGLLCADPERWNQLKAETEGANSPEWPIVQTRANEAAARAFWPLGNTRLEKRLPLIEATTLLIWGEQDRIMPRGYADRFAAAIAGRAEITTISGAGHLAELDKPDEVAAAILRWTA